MRTWLCLALALVPACGQSAAPDMDGGARVDALALADAARDASADLGVDDAWSSTCGNLCQACCPGNMCRGDGICDGRYCRGGALCDAGTDAAVGDTALDAGPRFDAWADCHWIDGANTCLCDGVAACDPVAGGAWAPLGSSAMRTCARRGSTCDIAYFTETEGGAAAYRCSITIGACGFDVARDCEQVLSCNLLMGDCPAEIVPTNVVPCALVFP